MQTANATTDTETQDQDELFSDILDTNLDDIEDLPEYLDYCPTGAYLLKITGAGMVKVELDKKKDFIEGLEEAGEGKIWAPVLQVQYEIQSIGELKRPEEADQVKCADTDGKGSYFSESFFFHKDPKKAKAIVKVKYKEIAAKFGFTTVGQTIEGMKDIVISAMVQSTKSQKDKDKYFINTKNIQPV
jgi:hypothetical protein